MSKDDVLRSDDAALGSVGQDLPAPALASCPFCGGADTPIVMRYGDDEFAVECELREGGCGGVLVEHHETPEAVIAAWNRRYDPVRAALFVLAKKRIEAKREGLNGDALAYALDMAAIVEAEYRALKAEGSNSSSPSSEAANTSPSLRVVPQRNSVLRFPTGEHQ